MRFVFLTVLIVFPIGVNAQLKAGFEKSREKFLVPNRFWADLYCGIDDVEDAKIFGLSYVANLHYLDRKYRHYELRYANLQSFTLSETPKYQFSDLGYLFGCLLPGRFGLFELAAGPSLVFGYRAGKPIHSGWWSTSYEKIYFVGSGLALELDCKFQGGRSGFGISIKGNLNSQLTYFSFGLELSIGSPKKAILKSRRQ